MDEPKDLSNKSVNKWLAYSAIILVAVLATNSLMLHTWLLASAHHNSPQYDFLEAEVENFDNEENHEEAIDSLLDQMADEGGQDNMTEDDEDMMGVSVDTDGTQTDESTQTSNQDGTGASRR